MINVTLSPRDFIGDDVLPEPAPDWPEAEVTWRMFWPIHTYGFAALHVLLFVYDVSVLLHLNRRLRAQPYLLHALGVMLALSSAAAVLLLADPYESRRALPTVVARVAQGLTFPCMTSSFTFLQLLVLRMTRVSAGRARRHRVVRALVAAHFALVVTVYATVTYHVRLKLLLMLTQTVFITWGLVLCFTFIYNGFKIAQFTNETQRVLKEITMYSKVRREALRRGDPRDLALHRISKPRVVDEGADGRVLSERSNDSGAESSDSLSFLNDAALEWDEAALARLYTRPRERPRPSSRRPSDRTAPAPAPRGPRLRLQLSSESDYVTDGPSNTSGFSTEERPPMPRPPPPSASAPGLLLSLTALNDMLHTRRNNNNPLDENNLNANVHVNQAFDTGCDVTDGTDGTTSEHAPFIVASRPTKPCSLPGLKTTARPEDPQEGGYLADTELGSPRGKGRGRRGRPPGGEDAEEVGGSPTLCPYPLPLSDGSLGLYRIRQGRVLSRVLRVAYACTLLLFVQCVLQLYAMFGAFGVLSRDPYAEPWPWIVFHTCSRLCELGTGGTVVWICHSLGRQRHRQARRRHRKALHSQTTC